MLNLKSEFKQMIQDIDEKPEQEVSKLKVLWADTPVLFAGLDTVTMSRQLYIDLGPEAWEPDQIKALPKWRGLSIKSEYFDKLALLRNHHYLVLRQESEQSTEIFEVVLQNLVDHLMTRQEDESLFSSIYKVLDRWRNFFQRGGFRKLTEEQQRGLFGEMWYMKEWLNHFSTEPPLIVEQWEGPLSGRIDFKNTKRGIEIKTVMDKLTKSIKISNENQLKLTNAVNSIFVYVCFIEKSKTHGITLQTLVNEVRESIASRSDRLLLKFNEMLTEFGFRDDEYSDTLFFVEKTEAYEAAQEFPRITQELLPKGISHVSYSIDLTHCTEFQRDVEEVFKV